MRIYRLLSVFTSKVSYYRKYFKSTQKVKVLSPPETIKEKSMLRAKALRWEVNISKAMQLH